MPLHILFVQMFVPSRQGISRSDYGHPQPALRACSCFDGRLACLTRHVPGNIYTEKFGNNLDNATNELVIRIQPKEAIYLKINNKV